MPRLPRFSSARPLWGSCPSRGVGRRLARITSFDRQLARRALALGVGLVLVLAIIVYATDEQSQALASRLGRLASVVAIAGGLGAFLAAEQARARGELRALAALGIAPGRASLGAAAGGAIVALLGPILVLSGWADTGPLFPRLEAGGGTFQALGPATVLEISRGVLLEASGALSAAQAAGGVAPTALVAPRVATAVALLVTGVAVAWWAVLPRRPLRRIVVVVLAALWSVVLFHLVAAGRAPAFVLPLSPLVLVADAAAKW